MLYSFLTSDDLATGIKDDMLDQLVRGDLGLIAAAERGAVSWMKDYLGQRFDLAATFPTIGEWSAGNDYAPAQVVIVPGTLTVGDNLFLSRDSTTEATSYTPLYEFNAGGRLTNYAWHAGKYYEAIGTSLNVEPGTDSLAAALAWRARDPRDPKLVAFCMDVTLFMLHKRVAPRKISDLRVSLYNAAKEWLTMVSEGVLTPDLPRKLLPADSSDTIRWGSNMQQGHYY